MLRQIREHPSSDLAKEEDFLQSLVSFVSQIERSLDCGV